MKEKRMNDKSWINRVVYVFFAFVPLLAAIFMCELDGHSLREVYIPLSGWNDELTYYKQIEAMISGGIKGYFGYNQSHALLGGYAAWGPLSLYPYAMWGILFGWNLLSPIWANIFFYTLALVFFIVVLKPNKLQCFVIGCCFFFMPIVNRHIISGITESLFISLCIIYITCSIFLLSDCYSDSVADKKRKVILFILMLSVFCLTITRGYFAVLYLTPFVYSCKTGNKNASIRTTVVCLFTFALFLVSRLYLCASYYGDSYSFNIAEVKDKLLLYARICWYAIRYKDATVPWCYLSWTISYVLVVVTAFLRWMIKRDISLIHLITIVTELIVFGAIMTMYPLYAGGRHFLSLMCINIIVIGVEEFWAWTIPIIVLGISQFWLINPSESISYIDSGFDMQIERLKEEMREKIVLSEELSYDNVISMPTYDYSYTSTGEIVCSFYGYLFAAPAGMGISLDTGLFYEDTNNQLARYVMLHPDGQIVPRLESIGYKRIIQSEDYVVLMRD